MKEERIFISIFDGATEKERIEVEDLNEAFQASLELEREMTGELEFVLVWKNVLDRDYPWMFGDEYDEDNSIDLLLIHNREKTLDQEEITKKVEKLMWKDFPQLELKF